MANVFFFSCVGTKAPHLVYLLITKIGVEYRHTKTALYACDINRGCKMITIQNVVILTQLFMLVALTKVVKWLLFLT